VRRSSRLILLVGIFLAVGAFILIVFLNAGGRPSASPTPAVAHIVVAAVDIPQGTTITESMLTTKDVSLAEKPADSVALTASAIGKPARQGIAAGAYVPESAISNVAGPGSQTVDVSADLKPGERAMAIAVDALTGVGTLIQPGDRVDILFSFSTIKDTKDPEIPVILTLPRNTAFTCPEGKLACDIGITSNPISTKIIVQNVRVIGAKFSVATPESVGQPVATPVPGTSFPLRTELVMVAVSAQQAEVLGVGQFLAKPMTLLLRAPADAEASPEVTTGIILKTLIEEYGVLPPLPVSAPLPTELTPR
jgi:Flp pilus assembly protein CpaB